MKALVLAAGLGERVRPLTEKIPKAMLEVGGRPLIHYPLAMLRRAGIAEVAVNVHHLPGEIQKRLGNGRQFGLHITYSPEPRRFGTGGALNVLKEYLGNEPFVIANSDTIIDLDLGAMIEFHRVRGGMATLALRSSDDAERYGAIEIDRESRIRRMRLLKTRQPLAFEEYPLELEAEIAASLIPHMYCGVLVAEPAVFNLMPQSPPWGLINGLFAPMVARGVPIFGYVHRGYFRTVDDLKSYDALTREFELSPPRFEFLA